jgi:ribosomal protein S27E
MQVKYVHKFIDDLGETEDKYLLSLREKILNGKSILLNIKCGKCGTNLINPTGSLLHSNPPRINVACAKCGNRKTVRY